MLRNVDRIVLRVPGLPAAVAYYRDILGLQLIRQEARHATFRIGTGGTELLIHTDADLPGEAVYYLVDDVRAMYEKRAELRLTFVSPPKQAARGYRATVRDPFGTVLLLIDRTTEQSAGQAVEDARAPTALFAGVEADTKLKGQPERLALVYEKIGRTADDLPYTPHFETLYSDYVAQLDPKPTRQEVWRQLLNLRKKRGKLVKLGEARSKPPEISEEARASLKNLLGEEIGKRDRLPYTSRFDALVDTFNKGQPRPISPHLVWRLVATLAK